MFLTDPDSASITLAKLQNPVKQSFDAINDDLKEIYKGLGNYGKALDKVRAPARYPSQPLIQPPSCRNSRTSLYRRQNMTLYHPIRLLSTGPLPCIYFARGNSPSLRRSLLKPLLILHELNRRPVLRILMTLWNKISVLIR